MSSRPIIVDWREASPLAHAWRDAYENVIERLMDEWELLYADSSVSFTDIVVMAYEASRHISTLSDTGSLRAIARHPQLSTDGQLILISCGHSSPAVVEADVVALAGSSPVTNATMCSAIRPMRLMQPNEDELSRAISRRLTVLRRQGIAVRSVGTTLSVNDYTFTNNEHLDY